MAVQGSRGKVTVFNDFINILPATTVTSGTVLALGDITITAVSGSTSIASSITEGAGVLVCTTAADGAADGTAFACAAGIAAENAPMFIEARFLHSSASDFRFFLGFQETYLSTEPVNPFTLSGTTLTATASAGICAGFYYDSAATTDDFRFMARTDAAALTTAPLDYALGGQTTLGSLGVRVGSINTATGAAGYTASTFCTARVEVDPDGTVRGYFGNESMAQTTGMTHIATLRAGTISTTAALHPNVQLLQSSTGTVTSSIDYFLHGQNRNWAA